MSNPLVSIIIPTFNSEVTLGKCIKSITNQTYPNIEVIVIDNLSSDRTAQLATTYNVEFFQLRAERAKAKNFGVSTSRGKYLLFIDSDMELAERVVQDCVNIFERDPKIGGIIIPERSIGNNFWVKVRDFERIFYYSSVIESARFFKSCMVKKVGGFDSEYVFFEESILPQKINDFGYTVNIRVENAEIHHHEESFSLLKWLKKKYYYGMTAGRYMENFPEYGGMQLNPFYRLGLFIKNREFYSKPILALGVLILKLLEYIAILLGRLNNQNFNLNASN